MSIGQAISTYLAGNILLVGAFTLLLLTSAAFKMLGSSLAYRDELKLHYFAIFSLLLLVAIHPFLPKRELFEPMARIWAAPSASVFSEHYGTLKPQGYFTLNANTPRMIELSSANQIVFSFSLFVGIASLFRLLRDLFRILRISSRAHAVRSLCGTVIYVSDEINVPFSFWFPRKKGLVLSENLLGTTAYRIAVLHEIQHHRQGDTKWVYLLWALRVVFVLNPVVHIWSRWISEIQEFACDEALVASRKVNSHAYASCLLQVAESAMRQEQRLVCATGLTFLYGRKTLKRRITKMFDQQNKKLGRGIALAVGAALVAILGATAYASQGLVQDRRITLTQAQEMAKSVRGTSDFPLVINDRVVKWLNYYLGTPEGREKGRAALVRMENYRATIERKLDQYHLPTELMAIPLIEAGYQNRVMTGAPYSGGLWMFIPSTARTFGLKVDDEIDERLNVELSTDSALRYLYSEKLRFNDWLLSTLSYNGGERKVKEVMEKTGSRDPWVLIRSGLFSRETEEYVPKMMAAILIMKNPSALQ